MRRVGIALYGFGTVGTGLQRVLRARDRELGERHGVGLALRHVVVRDPGLRREETSAPATLSTDCRLPLLDPGVEVVVEVMGGIEPAGSIVAEALRGGRPVVTANKALIASRGRELEALADAHGVELRYEAAVGGAIPILHALRGALVGSRISRVRGILNGTCNYVLTRMAAGGITLETALRDAQALGFAEADPHLDVSGQDAAHKLLILARHAFGEWLDPARLGCRGIEGVTLDLVREAHAEHAAIRLVAEASRGPGGVAMSVAPVRVPAGDSLYAVPGAMNAVEVEGDFSGPLLFAGPGAGGDPTASALYADLVEIALVHALRRKPAIRLERAAGPPPLAR